MAEKIPEPIRYERDGIKRDGAHVLVGTGRPLADNFIVNGQMRYKEYSRWFANIYATAVCDDDVIIVYFKDRNGIHLGAQKLDRATAQFTGDIPEGLLADDVAALLLSAIYINAKSESLLDKEDNLGKINSAPGYHLKNISKGVLGELSKIREELDEAEDAEDQGSKVMLLVELSDLLGAVEGYLAKHMPDFTLQDLINMKNITQRAFKNGHRK